MNFEMLLGMIPEKTLKNKLRNEGLPKILGAMAAMKAKYGSDAVIIIGEVQGEIIISICESRTGYPLYQVGVVDWIEKNLDSLNVADIVKFAKNAG